MSDKRLFLGPCTEENRCEHSLEAGVLQAQIPAPVVI